MSIKYSPLATIEFLHDYYEEALFEDFEIVPTESSIATMLGQKILYKVIGNKLIILVATDETGLPLISFDNFNKLGFYLKLSNAHFENLTNLENLNKGTKKYYFNNANQTKIGSVLYLNSKIPLYNGADDYVIGSLAANGANDVFEAIQPSSNIAPHALNETDFWFKRGKLQYVNNQDLIEITSNVYRFETPAATNFTINVFAENPANGNLDVLALNPVNLSFTEAQMSVPVLLKNIPNGRYRLEVNGISKVVYLDNDILFNNAFGIVELNNLKPASNAFSLFDASGRTKNLLFSIRFANRLIFWKYISKSADITAVNDSRPIPDKYIFVPGSGNEFISSKPLPLTEKPITTLSIESTALGQIAPVANPPVNRLAKLTKDGNTYFCAEMHLNY